MPRIQLVLMSALFLLHLATLWSLLIAQQNADVRQDEMKGGIINLYKNQQVIEESCKGGWL